MQDDAENIQPNQNMQPSPSVSKQIIYLDRNNTPDIWADIHNTILKSKISKSEYKTVLLVPEQHPFDKSVYHTLNPISPQFQYECIKRIFGRKEHDCLSSANKPKVVEVILKFAKLYDGVSFDDHEQLRKHFDHFLTLDFMRYSERPAYQPKTIEAIVKGYNMTPPNF